MKKKKKDYRTVDYQETQSNVELPNGLQENPIKRSSTEQNRIPWVRLDSTLYDCAKIELTRFCSITERNRTLIVRLSSIGFWFDFVR